MTVNEYRRVLYLVTCAAPPCQMITELVDLLHNDQWEVHAIATPSAVAWLPLHEVEQRIGRPVLHRRRQPGERSLLPPAEAIAVVPATFNTVNAWATGINDTLALGILNEALSTGLPIVASVYAKPSLISHPAFAGHLRTLSDAGVRFTEVEALRPAQPDEPFIWQTVIDLLQLAAPRLS